MNIQRVFILIIGLVLATTATPLSGQTRKPASKSTASKPATLKLEDLPKIPIDTIATNDPESKIIIFSNNTWEYYRPTLVSMDALPVYSKNWDTTHVFSYRSIELADLPAVIDINLVTSLSEFKAPIKGRVLSKYGPRGRRNHNGVDIPLKIGEPIYATFDGKIRYAKFNTGGFGNLVIIRHPNGLETWNGHLSKLNVNVGDYVKAGQVIGFGGSTGRSRGPHLHFEMRYADQTFDPEFILDFESGQLKYQTFALEKSFFNIRSRASEILDEEDDYDFPLLAANNDSDTTSLDILERIAQAQTKEIKKTPTTSASSGGILYHTVKSGDMLGKLAQKYGVRIKQICQLNNITEQTTLKLGAKLRIK